MNLKIKNKAGVYEVDRFNNFTMSLKYDSIASSFSFQIYFDPENEKHAQFCAPGTYADCTVEHEGELLITGTMLINTYGSEATPQLTQLAGYSKTGVLEDCEIPITVYPLQTDGLSLKEIAERIIKPFGLKLVVDEIAKKDSALGLTVKQKSDKKINKSTAKQSQNCKSYLTELTKQRHIILTHNNKGDLVFTEAKTNEVPLFEAKEGDVPATSIKLTFNGQALHSHITVLKQADSDGGPSGEYTLENPYVSNVYRPKVVTMDSGDDITIQEFALNVLAAELKEAIRLSITTDRWKIKGEVVKPNNLVTVYSPANFIYEPTDFFIEEVVYNGDEKSTTATISCVIPEVYNGKMPNKKIFIDPFTKFPGTGTLKNYYNDRAR